MKFAPNTLNIFSDLDIAAQLRAIRRAGFEQVEILFPYLYPLEDLKGLLKSLNLGISLMDVLPGDVRNLDISAAIDPCRRAEFREYARLALETAEVLDVPCINCIAGTEKAVPGVSRAEMLEVYKENVRCLCSLFRDTGRKVLVEAVSEHQFPGYVLDSLDIAAAVVSELSEPVLHLQFDFFHVQMLHGNLIGNLRAYYDRVGYYQIANPPGRHQPGSGEIDFRYVLGELASLGYDGVVGLEYVPEGSSEDSFAWINELEF